VTGVGLVPSIVPVSMWRVGGLGVAALPSEVTKQMGQRIRRALEADAGGAYDRVALAGLTNAYVSYTATPEEYDGCHYEGAFTLFGRQQGARFLGVARQVNRALLDGGQAPSAPEPPALGAGTTADTPPRATPGAGTVVAQPAARVARTGRVAFSWKGGDPSSTRRVARRSCACSAASAAPGAPSPRRPPFRDITRRAAGDVWTHTVQLTECDRTASYRLAVDGVADRGAGPQPYACARTRSRSARRPGDRGAGRRWHGRPGPRPLPDPGDEALLALPRIVTTGVAVLQVTEPGQAPRTILARPDAATGTFTATVPAGSSATLSRVTDGCGNAS
jgi:hypothetical protein